MSDKALLDLHIKNIKALLKTELQHVLNSDSIKKLEDAISTILGNKKQLSKFPVLINVNIGKTFELKREEGRNVVIAKIHKISCTCHSSIEDKQQSTFEEKDVGENTLNVRYMFYIPELLRAAYKRLENPVEPPGKKRKRGGKPKANPAKRAAPKRR